MSGPNRISTNLNNDLKKASIGDSYFMEHLPDDLQRMIWHLVFADVAFEAANRASVWNLTWSQYYPYDAFQFNAVHKNEIDISQFDPDDLNGAQYGHENEIAYNLTDLHAWAIEALDRVHQRI